METSIWQFIFTCADIVSSWLVGLSYIFLYIGTYLTNFFSQPLTIIGLITFFSFWGFNFSFWGTMGLFRLIQERLACVSWSGLSSLNRKLRSSHKRQRHFTAKSVAAIVPAHNEELVIAKTITSLLPIVPWSNIFVISDGSVDKTAEIARSFHVNVLELSPARGKAGALLAGIERFALGKRFKAVIFVDADTVLPADYLDKALPFFADKEVVAIAGYARTIWDPAKQTFRQIYFIAHREIVYTLSQLLLKWGQSWKYANVATIIPGFASIYRSSVLEKINLNPPGLVIEDFNMTFEVHHKKLGRIVHSPKVSGYTQDPDNLHDYFRQVKRWDLGFWQTIRYHGLWSSKFSVCLVFFVTEVLLSSIVLVFIPLLFICLLVLALIPGINPQVIGWLDLVVKIIFFSIWLPNAILGCVVGIIQKRPQYFLYAPFFIFLKFLDSVAFLNTLVKAFLTHSSGQWVSPSRRAN
jgi:poly-beta-1,6-N-acetyl-D-glucosamine synthase